MDGTKRGNASIRKNGLAGRKPANGGRGRGGRDRMPNRGDFGYSLPRGSGVADMPVRSSVTMCAQTDDPKLGMKAILTRNGMKCRRAEFEASTARMGLEVNASKDGKKFVIAYVGNRDYEIMRIS